MINEDFLLKRGYKIIMFFGTKHFIFNGKSILSYDDREDVMRLNFAGKLYKIDTVEKLEALETLSSLLEFY